MPPSATEIVTHPNQGQAPFLPRSASYTHLPSVSPTESRPVDLRRTFSDVSSSPGNFQSPSKETISAGKDILRRTSLGPDERPSIDAVSRHNASTGVLPVSNESVGFRDGATRVLETRPPEPVAHPAKGRSMSGKLVSFARKPWSSSNNTRPRSPSVRSEESRTAPQTYHARVSSQPDATASVADSTAESSKRQVLYKRPRRPTLAVVADGGSDNTSSPTSPAPSLRSKSSFSKFSLSSNVSTPVLPPMPKNASATATAVPPSNINPPRKKDELWNVFRNLDADYQKFQLKSSALKANVIRSSLMTFLSRHFQTSCGDIRPEDLDRRVNILNKWWTGLLEMLNGKNNQTISGTDRPVYLEAVVGIMTRPEWRVPFLSIQSNGSATNLHQHSASVSEKSDASSASSEFLVVSIHHNVRNIFVQNLLSQMAFVVGRMSMRHAPASLVAFCGKVCAYAFFFCPGVADILIRLWNTPADLFRRVLEESGIRRSTDMRFSSCEFALNFPASLRTLTFQSYASFVRYLRRNPDVPLNTSQIAWQGPWISRWCGRDTDLFFVFVKYVHVLYSDYFSPDMEKSKRILAPGLLPVHAQLLAVLEDALYKPSTPQLQDNSHVASSVTFDDFIEGADASVSALPLGASNGNLSMAENRLIILLRDFLSDSSTEPNSARLLYAGSFCSLTKVMARKTSLFDSNACFVLCDFIEEAIPILAQYSQSVGIELVDWEFWLQVCRLMLQSHNSLTEIRVFSFLYGIWNTWVATEQRKSDLCFKFLLHGTLFYHYFGHWSSMVRAYFQRLLCWRLARFTGEPTSLNSTIYEVLSDRLQQVFTYYLAYQSRAEEEGAAPLSSAPCTPAPGRRIIIIRCDNQPNPAPSFFVSFDRFVPPSPPAQATPSKSPGFLKNDQSASESQPAPKKRWNLFRSVFGGSSSSKPGDQTAGSSLDETDLNEPPSRASDDQTQAHNGSSEQSRLKMSHHPFSFKFSLEWMDRPQWPNRNRRLTSPCLPKATQSLVQCQRSVTGSDNYETASEYASDEDFRKTVQSHDGSGQNKHDMERTVVLEKTDPITASAREAGNQATAIKLAASKYAGRALAEWAIIVSECDSFFTRRRDEGVPSDQLVETPMLGVESFRK